MVSSKNFKKLRRAVGLTQAEFSIELKIKRSLVGAYEENRAAVNPEVIQTLIKKGFLLRGELFDFMFKKNWVPSPTKRYRKVIKYQLVEV